MKSKLWTKDFLGISFIGLFAFLTFLMLMTTIAVYSMDTFHAAPGAAGLSASIFVISAIFTRLFAGRWMDRIGRRKMLLAGLLFNFIISLLYFGANSFLLLLVVRFLHGSTFGIISALTGTIIANIVPRDRLGEGIGYYSSLSGALAMAIGPFLGIFISEHSDFTMVFIVSLFFAIASFAITFIVSIPEANLSTEQLQETAKIKLSSYFAVKAIPIAAVCTVIYLCHASIISFLSAYAKEIQMADAASFFFVIFAVVIIVSRIFTGRLFDIKGENIVMYPSMILFTAGLFTLSQSFQWYTLIATGILVGIGIGTIQTSCQTIALKVSPAHHTGLATATFFTAVDMGVGIGPIIFGSLIPLIGYRGMYGAAAVVALLSVLLYYLLHGRKASLQ